MPPIADAIDSLKTGTYTVKRRPAMTYLDGVATVTNPETTFPVDAVVWPVSGLELQRLPEGIRGRETKRVVTRAQLFSKATANAPDVITIGALDFEVSVVESWDPHGFGSYLVTKMGAA